MIYCAAAYLFLGLVAVWFSDLSMVCTGGRPRSRFAHSVTLLSIFLFWPVWVVWVVQRIWKNG